MNQRAATARRRACLFPITGLLLGATCAVVAAPPAESAPAASRYALGRGLELGKYDLTVGGYANFMLRGEDERPWSVSAEDLSLFLTWKPSDRWTFFSEIEVGEAVTLSEDGFSSNDADFDLERLYVDYSVTAPLTLRAGKFLTPIGKWNVVHAAPLVWTTSRPLITQRTFARQSTGMMAHGTVMAAGRDLDYSVYLDDSDDLDPEREEAEYAGPDLLPASNFDNAAGLNLRYHLLDDALEVGLSYANFDMVGLNSRQNLIGADLQWLFGRAEISGEAAYRASSGSGDRDEWGAFLQGVMPLVGDLYGVARGEIFESAATGDTARLGTLGLAYRPIAPVVFKLEHLWGEDNDALSPDGWFGSVAILF